MNASPPLFSLLAAVALASVGRAENAASPDASTAKTAVTANDRAYEAAYAKGDVKALADFFSDDAEFITEEGRIFSGKAAIEASIREGFTANSGAKLTIQMDSVDVLSPEVVLEKGSTTVTRKNGETVGALYTAIYVKKDGEWKIHHLVETPQPAPSPHDHLTELAWLIGTWEDMNKADDLSVHSEYVWARGGNFITRNVTVKHGGQVTLEGWQVIGWDPAEERIHSWTFDSAGGFAEGTFTREGNRWLLRETGTTPDGNHTTADNTFQKVSEDHVTWSSGNRTVNGDLQPGIGPIEINRVKGN